MTIGEAALACGLPTKTIRYYEDIGLVRSERLSNGYRRFGPREIDQLAFLARARDLGFGIEDCRALLALRADRQRASADVKAVAEAHLTEIDRKVAALSAMREELAALVERCAGDDRPDCAILDGLAARAARTA